MTLAKIVGQILILKSQNANHSFTKKIYLSKCSFNEIAICNLCVATFKIHTKTKKMKNNKSIYAVLIALVFSLITSCNKSEKSKTMSDDTYYKEIAYCLSKCYSDVYNQSLAGKPVGYQNFTTTGPMGGSIEITGNTTQDNTNNITTTDLVFAMNDVSYSTTSTNLNQTGSVTYKGSFSPNHNNTSHLSNSLRLSGKVTKDGVTRNVDLNTTISINVTKTTVSATIDGHNVNW